MQNKYAVFYVLYIYFGISDIVDGFIARKLGFADDGLGAKPDSFADLIMLGVCAAKIRPVVVRSAAVTAFVADVQENVLLNTMKKHGG